MSKTLRIFFLIGLFSQCTLFQLLSGQEKDVMVKYTPGFRFNDGIFVDFEQVKLNSPIPKSRLLTSLDYNDREFFKKIFEMDKIYFYDPIYNQIALPSVARDTGYNVAGSTSEIILASASHTNDFDI